MTDPVIRDPRFEGTNYARDEYVSFSPTINPQRACILLHDLQGLVFATIINLDTGPSKPTTRTGRVVLGRCSKLFAKK